MTCARSFLLACLLPLACTTASVGVGNSVLLQVPSDGVAQCDSQCGTMGLRTTAVVVMAGRIGCVCESAGAAARTDEESAALAGGMAAVVQQEQEEERRRQRAAAQ